MHVIGHDHRHVEFISTSMIMETRRKYDFSSNRRQNPPELGNKGDEVRREVLLKMRQVAPIELHKRILSCASLVRHEC